MKSIVIVLSIVLVAAQAWPQEGKGKGAGGTVAGEVGKKLDAYLMDLDKGDGGYCGNALVAVGGKVLLEKGYGLADAEAKRPMPVGALWDWASVTKQFTAAAVLRLQDKKKLKVDDPIKKFFPEAPADKAAVTLRQLLSHTSGIEAGFKNEWKMDGSRRESLEKTILGLPMTSKPGQKFEYSNSGYGFLAAIVERVSGKTFEEFCVAEVFKPAGMKDACLIGMPQLDLRRVPKIGRGQGFTDRPKDYAFADGNSLSWGYRGCGGAVMTTRDMFQWDRALRNDKFLSKASKEDFFTPLKDNYALGWQVGTGPFGRYVAHSGGVLGVVTYLIRGTEDDWCVALTWSYDPKRDLKSVAEALMRLSRNAG